MSKVDELLKDAQLIFEANRVLVQRRASEADPKARLELLKDWLRNGELLRIIDGQLQDAIIDEGHDKN